MKELILFFILSYSTTAASSIKTHLEIAAQTGSKVTRLTVTSKGDDRYLTFYQGKQMMKKIKLSKKNFKYYIKKAEEFGQNSLLQARSSCPRSRIYFHYTPANGKVRRFSSCQTPKTMLGVQLQDMLDRLALLL